MTIYTQLKNLHTNALNYLTELFNEIFKSSEFPSKWKTAIVIPILKPKSDQFNPQSYRPISLTSVLGKTFEKIINKRLTWYLESNNIITKYQYGFRKSRSTEHAILDLHSEIKHAFASKSCLHSIFFDLEKAYDRVWRYHICQMLFKYGLRGHLPYILQSFLKNRSLTVRLGGHLSTQRNIENGVPQGSVLSVSLFLIAINEISSQVHFPITQ